MHDMIVVIIFDIIAFAIGWRIGSHYREVDEKDDENIE